MSTKTLFLAWQDQDKRKKSHPWFPVGRLDVESSFYRFRYINGAKRAEREIGFPPLIGFPELDREYRSSELFALFRNRVMAKGRPDRLDYLSNLDLPEDASPVEILSVNGGSRVTDAYEVFPKLEKDADGYFTCRFFLHSWQRASKAAQERIDELKPEEELYVTLELTNPATKLAVQIQTTDYYMIGWTPRYLVSDLAMAMTEGPNDYTAKVVRVNPMPAPSRQRVLIEMSGRWKKHEPMSGKDFQPLVSARIAVDPNVDDQDVIESLCKPQPVSDSD